MQAQRAAALPPRQRTTPKQRYVTWQRHRHARRMVDQLCMPPAPEHWRAFGRAFIVPPARIENPDCIEVGDGVIILENVWMSVVRHFPDIVPRVVIEDKVRIGRSCQLSVAGSLTIERGAIIGDFVQIGDTYHPYDYTGDRLPVLTRPEPVRIGRGAVLASHAIVLPGITVGAGSYVDHHAIVTRDVAPNTVVAGSPARVVARP